jgi:phosphoglucomutase
VSTPVSALAGQPTFSASLVDDVSRLVTANFSELPDPAVPAQRVAFGTSRHRGSAFDLSSNDWHVLAITQALCDDRRAQGIAGPIFLGIDTQLSPQLGTSTELAGEKIQAILTHAPANGAAIGGIRVGTASGWFAARPSGAEDI